MLYRRGPACRTDEKGGFMGASATPLYWGAATVAALLSSVLAAVVHLLAHAALQPSLGQEAFAAAWPTICALTLCARARGARSGKKAARRVEARWGAVAKELARVDSPEARNVSQSASDLLETAYAVLTSAGGDPGRNVSREKDLDAAMLRWPRAGDHQTASRSSPGATPEDVRTQAAALAVAASGCLDVPAACR
ncbi:hypothetical protein T484DRAFT_1900638, partial [Baffinella frigidus]